MYTLTNDQEKEIQSFIDKLPDSMVKSHITNLFAEVWPTNRMTSEQLEKFRSFQNALPLEVQSYPQVVSQWFKNEHETKRKESELGIDKKSQVDFKGMAAESRHAKIEKLKGDKGDQKQEILHTLNVEDKALAGTKAVSKLASEQPSYEEKLITEAAKSAKTSGGKPAAQKKEEESIIARNRSVDAKSEIPKTTKTKEVVLIPKKSASKEVKTKRSATKSRR